MNNVVVCCSWEQLTELLHWKYLLVIKAKIEQPTKRARIMKITKNFGWVKESAFAFSILNFLWLNLMGEVLSVVLGVVMGEVCDEISKLTNHQYMTLIEKWPLQEWQALSLFHCMHFQNKSILHNFLACNLYQWIKFWTLETTKSSKTISRDLCYCQVNLTRKLVVQRCDFGHDLGLWIKAFDYLNIFLKDKVYLIRIHHIQLDIQNCVL